MERTLRDSCDVVRDVVTLDQYQSESKAPSVVHTYPCKANILTGFPRNLIIADQDKVRAQWEISLPLTADVLPEDTLRVGAEVYIVLDTDAGRTGALLLLARCRKEK